MQRINVARPISFINPFINFSKKGFIINSLLIYVMMLQVFNELFFKNERIICSIVEFK